MTSDEAQKIIDEERKQRREQCKAELDIVLKKHGCTLEAQPRYIATSGGWVTVADVLIVAV